MNEVFSSWVCVLACAMVLSSCRGSAEPESGEARQSEVAPATGAEAPNEGRTATASDEAQGQAAAYVPTIIQPDPSWPTPPAGMIYIPTADVWLGEQGDDVNPRRLVHVEGFFIDRTEVTAAAFERCVSSGRCPQYIRPLSLETTFPPESAVARWLVEQCNFNRLARADHPMNCVSRGEAAAYCNAFAGRLPRGEEWEYGARSTDQRRYPWGNEAASDGNYGNTADQSLRRRHAAEGIDTERWYEPIDDGFAASSPVGSFPRDTSPFGVVDAAGNVSEWSQDNYHGEEIDADMSPQALTLGGQWLTGLAPASYRNFFSELRRHPVVGFRCASDAPPLISPISP